MIEKMTKEMFAESLNTKFRVNAGSDRSIELELVELSEGVSTPKHEQFALLFRGPSDFFLPQGIYNMEHERLGEFDLFLVPVGRDERGFQYEAVFNRFIEPS
ncbi:MAG TPA: hypothetical protein VKB86_10070 [Pyrinomonadaceae bacterium]|nr:hypothetical protein [Pyrinomonadaceae bacterium]